MIFNIQKCSIHDGDGLRTLVFFKGCPLRCMWCANPESQSYQKEILESPVRCIGCGVCRSVCPEGAIRDDGTIDRDLCTGCFKCIDVCYAESKRIAGREYTVEELYHEIHKDKSFYSRYGGGVTFSGGEPLSHGSGIWRGSLRNAAIIRSTSWWKAADTPDTRNLKKLCHISTPCSWT